MTQQHEASPAEKTITRRAVTTTALWSVPVITAATAVPFAAATEATCDDSNIQIGWNTASMPEQNHLTDPAEQDQSFTNTVTFFPVSSLPNATGTLSPVVVTIGHTFNGRARGVTDGGNQYATINGSGNPNGVALAPGYYDISQRLEPFDTPGTSSDYSDWTFTFSTPMTDLSFTIADVDRALSHANGQQFIDAVSLHSADAPLTFSFGTGANFVGAGSIADPFRVNPSATTGNLPYTDARTHINVHATAPITTFTIRYFNLSPSIDSGISNQGVYLASFKSSGSVPCTIN
ncbi:MAG TPA: hypothetical protein PKE40_05480 [Arachnia sp.]|nr:hypothetical protein [Arachnia sp.]HMT85787.1 hypothetical protein [Arachnia sp.]